MDASSRQPQPLSVSELTEQIKSVLKTIWAGLGEGELGTESHHQVAMSIYPKG